MSAVRWCDKCERVFPEGEAGSATGTMTVNIEDPRTGRMRQEQKQQDQCGECTGYRPKETVKALTKEAEEEARIRQAEKTVAEYFASRHAATEADNG